MRFFSWVLLVFLSIVPRTTWAQTAEDEASARNQAGVTFANQGKWEPARLAFLQAYTLVPSGKVLWNLAFAELKSGHALAALGHFKTYERDSSAEPARIAALPMLRERAYQQIGRLKVQAPPSAVISIDGTQSTWAEPIDVQPGDHKVAAKVGDRSEERTVAIIAGQVLEVPFSFPEQSRAAAPTPSSDLSTPATDRPKSESTTKYWVAGGLGVTALAAASIGLVFGFNANAEKENVDNHRTMLGNSCDTNNPVCATWRDEAAAQQKHVDLARGFLIGSVALASAAVVTFFVWPRSNSTTSAVVVVPDAHGADLTFSTRF